MAEDLSTLLSDLRTAIEALVPVTDSSDVYSVAEDFSAEDWTDIPAAISHRAVVLDVLAARPVQHVAGIRTVWDIDVSITVVHRWRQKKRLADTTLRGQDVLQLCEMLRTKRPGHAAGARAWSDVEAGAPETVEQRRATTINAKVQAGFTTVVTP